ncbi:hypothetical protein SESBI_42843 [Sesbania bispinosa]|nr:hypothetical protein SESBI_42843 [Sesbania bispinosa]
MQNDGASKLGSGHARRGRVVEKGDRICGAVEQGDRIYDAVEEASRSVFFGKCWTEASTD